MSDRRSHYWQFPGLWSDLDLPVNNGGSNEHLNISNSSLITNGPHPPAIPPDLLPLINRRREELASAEALAVPGTSAESEDEAEPAEDTEDGEEGGNEESSTSEAAAAAATAREEEDDQAEAGTSSSSSSSSINEDGACMFWHRLPDVALAQVMSYLGDEDRCAASSACNSWRMAYKYPTLWRRRYFTFMGHSAQYQSEKHQKFLRHLGNHMHEMIVEISRPNMNTAGIIAHAFDQFVNTLNKLNHIRLVKFRLVDMDFHSAWRSYSHNRGILLRAICSLLKKQSLLRTVDLSYCLMDRDEGTRVLQALSYGTRHHPKLQLREVNIRQFFTSRTRAVSFVRYGKVMGQFPALVTLKMDYRGLNSAILQTLTNASWRTLRDLDIDYYSDEAIGDQGIGPEVWRLVASKLPDLRVKVRIRGLCLFHKYLCVLVRGMPLSELQVCYLGVEDVDSATLLGAIPTLFAHVACCYSKTLVKIHMQLRSELDPGADAAVVGLMRSCSKMKELHLNMVLQAKTVLQILEAMEMHKNNSSSNSSSSYPFSSNPSHKVKNTRLHLTVRGMTKELNRTIRQKIFSAGFTNITTRTLPDGVEIDEEEENEEVNVDNDNGDLAAAGGGGGEEGGDDADPDAHVRAPPAVRRHRVPDELIQVDNGEGDFLDEDDMDTIALAAAAAAFAGIMGEGHPDDIFDDIDD